MTATREYQCRESRQPKKRKENCADIIADNTMALIMKELTPFLVEDITEARFAGAMDACHRIVKGALKKYSLDKDDGTE